MSYVVYVRIKISHTSSWLKRRRLRACMLGTNALLHSSIMNLYIQEIIEIIRSKNSFILSVCYGAEHTVTQTWARYVKSFNNICLLQK